MYMYVRPPGIEVLFDVYPDSIVMLGELCKLCINYSLIYSHTLIFSAGLCANGQRSRAGDFPRLCNALALLLSLGSVALSWLCCSLLALWLSLGSMAQSWLCCSLLLYHFLGSFSLGSVALS